VGPRQTVKRRYDPTKNSLTAEPDLRHAVGQLLVDEVLESQEMAKTVLLDDIAKTLNLFPPHPSIEDILRDLRNFIDCAVKVANEMTSEKAIFYCFLANFGEIINEDEMCHVGGEGQGERVGMSHFPGFLRETKDNRIVLLPVEVSSEMILAHAL
jgi:hypothetical protein